MVGALAVYVLVHDVQFGEATGGGVPDFLRHRQVYASNI